MKASRQGNGAENQRATQGVLERKEEGGIFTLLTKKHYDCEDFMRIALNEKCQFTFLQMSNPRKEFSVLRKVDIQQWGP